MSYNLDIMKLRDFTSITFPVAFDNAPQEWAAVPWLELRAFLKERGARVDSDEHHLLLDFESCGSLEICGVRDPSGESEDFVLISFDVHTDISDSLAQQDRAILELFYSTGLRRSELARFGDPRSKP